MERNELTTTLANITSGLESSVAIGDLGAISNLVADLGRLRTALALEELAVAPQRQVERVDDDIGPRSHNIIVNATGLLELSGRVDGAVSDCYQHCVQISGKEMARQVILSTVTEIMDEFDAQGVGDLERLDALSITTKPTNSKKEAVNEARRPLEITLNNNLDVLVCLEDNDEEVAGVIPAAIAKDMLKQWDELKDQLDDALAIRRQWGKD